MLGLKKIAVTGGIGSGKSTVCCFFKELGAYTVSADVIVHQLLSPHTDLGKKIIALLGSDVVEKKAFNREVISQKVFRNPYLLQQLEQLLHPEVQKSIETLYAQLSHGPSNNSLFVVEIPLLYESGQEAFYDAVIAISCDQLTCLRRLRESSPEKEGDFYERSSRLYTDAMREQRADYIIDNSGSMDLLKETVSQVFNHLTKRSYGSRSRLFRFRARHR